MILAKTKELKLIRGPKSRNNIDLATSDKSTSKEGPRNSTKRQPPRTKKTTFKANFLASDDSMRIPSDNSDFSDWEWLAEVFSCRDMASEDCITEHANVLESTKPLTHSNFSLDDVKSEDLEGYNIIKEFSTSDFLLV